MNPSEIIAEVRAELAAIGALYLAQRLSAAEAAARRQERCLDDIVEEARADALARADAIDAGNVVVLRRRAA